jgi:hypothetical protein
MYQSSPRKNFLDFLIDPTSIAILCSIALHAILGASLPFFTQLEKEIKKADPGTVKVVELTPNELQRIPQAPPIPAPQIATPAPVVPSPQVVPPSTPPISPNSPTIPFSPIRIPLDKLNPKPAKGKKDQQAIPQKQPTAPLFDSNTSVNPTPKPTKSPDKKASTTKPTPIPITKPAPKPIVKKTKKTIVNPIPTVDSDDDGGDLQPTDPAAANPQAQKPANTPPVGTNSTRPAGGQSGTQPSDAPGSGGSGSSFPYPYGKYIKEAIARLEQYERAYPGLVKYRPELLSQPYPVGTICPKVQQAPFTVLMVAFDKVPDQKDDNPLGDSSAPSIDEPYVAADRDTPENRKLAELAVNTALYAANKADQNRPAADRGKRVLYQYTVLFDRTTCKR